jgi:CheY-like chemotaxis protein
VTTTRIFENTTSIIDIAALNGDSPHPGSADFRPGSTESRDHRRCPAVLVIDDDPLVRMVIEAALESFGEFEIWTASDGATGLNLFEAARPDFVFLDLLIPGKNGFAVLEDLQRRGKELDGVRVIVTSGLMGASVLERLATLGAPEILPKPFRLQDLRQIVAPCHSGDPIAAG